MNFTNDQAPNFLPRPPIYSPAAHTVNQPHTIADYKAIQQCRPIKSPHSFK